MGNNLENLSAENLADLRGMLTPRTNKYIPFEPTPKQTAALLMNPARELLYGGAAGGGKDLHINTPILTLNRRWQTMGSLQVGDFVFSETGKPTKVIWKSEVMHNKCYRLTFDKGREEIIAGEAHDWFVWRRRQDRKERVPEMQTTKQLYERFSNNAPRNRGSLYAINVAKSIKYPNICFVVDPYVFGVWLGDGNRQSGVISSIDEEIQQQFMDRGYDVYFTESCIQHDRPDIHPDGRLHHWCSKRLRDELRKMGFLYNSYEIPTPKTIPDNYLCASVENRLELLRGLMDTDGCAVDRPTGDVELTLANKELAEQCEELIRGLGIQVECKESQDLRDDPRYPIGEYTRYRLNWTTGIPMFHLSRKLALQAKETPVTQQWHYISNIEPVESVPTQCIQVADAPHLYLAGKTLIPTHNSVYLLTAALQYVDVPGYSAILFRKTFADLMLPHALIPMATEWLSPFLTTGEVRWRDKEKQFIFTEKGSTITFGYLDNATDHFRYQGAEFQFVGMDEVTHIMPVSYRYLFSRLRKLKGSPIPIRMRATANPGGTFGDYYYQRFFVDNKNADGNPTRFFLPAGLNDNPYLDVEDYRASLAELDPITREQLENGNWEIRPKGDLFDGNWLISIERSELPAGIRWVRYWDLASIDPRYRRKNTNTREPDFTIGFKLGMHQGCYYIADIIKVQKSPGDIEKLIKATAIADGYSCAIRMEEEGGSSGVANTDRYARSILMGFNFAGVKPVVSKIERARPTAAACQAGSVFVCKNCRGLLDLYSQLEAFPNGVHDDIVDAFSGAFAYFKPGQTLSAPDPALDPMRRFVRRDMSSRLELATGSYWHNSMSTRR